MNSFNFNDHPHRRYNPLTNEWLLVSPHRSKRPWQGQVEKAQEDKRPAHDPQCYLCAGNERAGGLHNPDYKDTFVFTNDFAALHMDVPQGIVNINELIKAESEKGICRVICFSPRHDLTLAEMEPVAIRKVIDLWDAEYRELGSNPEINYVQIFENKGSVMGCSNPHPHGQIWSQSTVPMEPAKEMQQQLNYWNTNKRSLLSNYLELELKTNERIVAENDHFVTLVPFWAVWPFETMIVSKRHLQNISQMSDAEKNSLAEMIKNLTVKYDNIFEVSFPYSSGMHQSPTDGQEHKEWHWHMHFYPPLLRSASVKKFMVGYEMLGNPQRDITPEFSAVKLRELPNIHYKVK